MADQASLVGEVFYPSVEVLSQAGLQDWGKTAAFAEKDLEGFWAKEAEELEWYRKWDRVLDDDQKPFFKWFTGGQVNIVHNCLDRHMKTWRKNKLALIWVGEPGDVRTYSYYALHREVCQFASVLRAMGINKGDRVTIYMPRIPEIVIAMLACAKVGAIHSVVYGGFSVDALQGRIEDSQSKVVLTADGGWMNGKIVELKKTVDEALRRCPSVESVIVVQRTNQAVPMENGRDYWYHELLRLPIVNRSAPTEVMDAEDPLYILYTSGTTGKPKAIVHVHGGYMVGVYSDAQVRLRPQGRRPLVVRRRPRLGDRPLLHRLRPAAAWGPPPSCTRARRPIRIPNRWWSMIEKYGINILYTAPTAIRGLMRFGESWPNRHDLTSLRLLGSVGRADQPRGVEVVPPGHRQEPLPDHGHLVADRNRDVHDHADCPSCRSSRAAAPGPSSGSKPRSWTQHGKPVPAGEEGYLVLKRPWPAMLRTIYKDPDRYVKQYWSAVPGLLHHRRLGQAGRGRLFLDHRPRGRRDQGVGLPAGHGRDRERPGQPPGRGRGRGHRPSPRGEGPRHPRLLHPPNRVRAVRSAGRGIAPARRPARRPHRPARARRRSWTRSPRPAPARSCGASSRRAPWACRKAICPRWRTDPPRRVASVQLTSEDLRELDSVASRITIQGARYPEHLQKLVGR